LLAAIVLHWLIVGADYDNDHYQGGKV